MTNRLAIVTVAIWEMLWAYGGCLIYQNAQSEYRGPFQPGQPDMSMFQPSFGEILSRLSPALFMMALPLLLIPVVLWVLKGKK